MGVDIEPDVLVFGYELGTLEVFWKALGIEPEQKQGKPLPVPAATTEEPAAEAEETVKVDVKALCNLKYELREIISALWSKFVQVYDVKYAGLKASGLNGYCGMTSGRNVSDYGLKCYEVFFGREIVTESIECVEDQFSLTLKLRDDIKEIMADFIAFNLKYGKAFLISCLTKETVNYQIIPDDEAAELKSASGIIIPDS